MTIICGTDLSHASTGAMAVARALATLRGESEVIVVHAVDSDAEGEVEHLRAALEDVIARAGEGPTLRAELVVGPPETALTSYAETEGSELIVIASNSNDKTSTLGSTAAKIIAITRTPVLVLRDPAPWLAFCAKTRPLKVLAAVDDSISADLGLQWMHGLRRQGPVEVVVGAVYYPDDAAEKYGLHAKTLVDRDPEIEKLLARDLIRRFGAGDGVVARTRRGLGRIGDHVIELANDEHVDALIVGTSQRTGLDRLGSVSSVVVEDAPQSVVCVPPSATLPTFVLPPMTIALVATDLSPFANRAVAYAFAAVPENGEIHIAHVVGEDDAVDEAEIVKQLLAQTPVPLAGTPRKVTAHVVRGDDAATAIAQTAARLGVDFIAIASHGRTGLTRALLGSVADKLLQATKKPVLVLRPG